MLPIMDAVKTDLNTAAKVRDHANKNWWNVIQNYSYVDEIMGKWTPNTIEKFRTKLKEMDQQSEIDIGPDSDYRGFGFLLTKELDAKDESNFHNLIHTLYDTLEYPPKQPTQSVRSYEAAKKAAAINLKNQVLKGIEEKVANKETLNPKQMLFLFDRIIDAVKLNSRNKSTIAKTAARRKKLFNKARSSQILQVDL